MILGWVGLLGSLLASFAVYNALDKDDGSSNDIAVIAAMITFGVGLYLAVQFGFL